MSITLDGQNLFDSEQFEIQIESSSRDSMEKTICGLDGVLSIDKGKRTRKIKQTGTIRAKSQLQMNAKINAIENLIDGNSHTLIDDRAREFENLRIDAFKISDERESGNGICCDYQIIYTQLAVD